MSEEERYAKVEADRQKAIDESNEVYDELLRQNRALTRKQNQYADNWQTTQSEIADKNATYQTELQNQNKQKAEKEFQNEAIASKNAYYDFINPYGAQAEIQAQNGLDNSGYSETTKLGAWNTQQNRTAKARASLNDAKLQYDNAIKEIELNRDTTKAQYALESLKMKLDAALKEYDNTSQLQQNRLSNSQALSSEYNNRYNTVWDQINTEKQFQENIRQFDENIKYLKEKDEREYQLEIQKLEEQKRQWEKEYELSLAKSYSYGGSYSGVDLTDSLPSDYYFSNGYQPQYINGSKLSKSGLKVSDVFDSAPVNGGQNIWSTNGRYYVWVGDGNQNGDYVDVTNQVNTKKNKKANVVWR